MTQPDASCLRGQEPGGDSGRNRWLEAQQETSGQRRAWFDRLVGPTSIEWNYLLHDWGALPQALKDQVALVSPGPYPPPRIGLHCLGNALRDGIGHSHQDRPWLFGSLVAMLLVERGAVEVYWRLEDIYPMTRGFLRAGVSSTAYLVVDRRVTSDDDLRAQRMKDGFRQRYQFKCDVCGNALLLREDTVQAPSTALHRAGVREISLSALRAAARVEHRR